MPKNVKYANFLKWGAIVVAGLVAAYQAFDEQRAEERIDNMEERIAALENSKDEAE